MPSVAIVGASADRRKFGNKAVRAYLAAGYQVFPVHPSAAEIEGAAAFAQVADIPVEQLDRVSVYLPPSVGLKVIEEIPSQKVKQLILNPGAESAELLTRARELGFTVVTGCSIILGGFRPEQFPDE